MVKQLRKHLKETNRKREQLLLAAVLSSIMLGTTPQAVWAYTSTVTLTSGTTAITDDILVSNADGLNVTGSGTSAYLTGNTVTVSGGTDKRAIYTANGGSTYLTGVTISNSSNSSGNGILPNGLSANDGTITMTDGSITTTGYQSIGVLSCGTAGNITLNNVTITDGSTNSTAVWSLASLLSSIIMNGGSITSYGSYNTGAVSGSGQITLNNVTLSTNGDDAYGLIAYIYPGSTERGSITMEGGSITTKGSKSYGAYANGGSITLNNVAINAAASDALRTDSSGSIIASVSGQSISAGNYLMYADDGSISLTATNGSQLSGATKAAGGTVNLTLKSGATWNNTRASSSLTSLTMDGGIVKSATPRSLSSSGSYKTITLGSLSGSGTFCLNSNRAAGYGDIITLNNAYSSSGTATATGIYDIYVVDKSGTPINPYTTYKVVDLPVSGTASFSGYSDLGAYRYGVAAGSSIANRSALYTVAGDSYDYYLYNTFSPSSASQAAMGLNATSTVVWYGEMNEIKKRMGDLRMGTQSSDDFWVRTYADKYSVKPGGSLSYKQLMHGLEIGKDNPQSFNGGKKYTGFVVGAGQADNNYSGASITTKTTYAGAYACWLRDDGAYVDMIGKYNWLHHSFTTATDSANFDNNAFGLSAEMGKRFTEKNGMFIEPEAELSLLWTNQATYRSTLGLAIDSPATRSLQLRLGITAGRKWQSSDGANCQIYGKLSWVNEFAGDSTTTIDSASFNSSLKGHQWVSGLGFIEDGRHYQVYIDLEKSWGSTTSKLWGGNIGYRWKF